MLLALILSACQSSSASGRASFQRIELIPRVQANGQLVLADMGGTTATDILLMSQRPGRLVWFESPDWVLHQIPLVADELQGVAAYSPPESGGDIDTSAASLALNGRFSSPGAGTQQQLIWLQNPGRSKVLQPWQSSLISNRAVPGPLLWVDMTGTGRQILVTLPALEAYTLPASSARSARPWGMMPLAVEPLPLERVRVYDWDMDGRDDLLVAGSSGLDIMALASRGRFIDELNLIRTDGGADTGSGAVLPGFRDVGVGQSGRAARRFVASLSVDGGQLLLFRPSPDSRQPWTREVVTTSLSRASTLQVADLNRDGFDEIIVGDANGLSIFYYNADRQQWLRHNLDTSVSIADMQVQDLSGNGFPDIVTAPAEPGPLLLFQNRGRSN